jgi:hypothetical protein
MSDGVSETWVPRDAIAWLDEHDAWGKQLAKDSPPSHAIGLINAAVAMQVANGRLTDEILADLTEAGVPQMFSSIMVGYIRNMWQKGIAARGMDSMIQFVRDDLVLRRQLFDRVKDAPYVYAAPAPVGPPLPSKQSARIAMLVLLIIAAAFLFVVFRQ